jgi:hypothetical protein
MASNECNIYSKNPMLKDVKTPFDLKMDSMYCNWAQSQDTGPMGKEKTVLTYKQPIPGPFMTLNNAYKFSGAPSQPNYQYNNNK